MLRFLANESKIRNAMSQSLSFHVPLDKGNEGSGNEIGWSSGPCRAGSCYVIFRYLACNLADHRRSFVVQRIIVDSCPTTPTHMLTRGVLASIGLATIVCPTKFFSVTVPGWFPIAGLPWIPLSMPPSYESPGPPLTLQAPVSQAYLLVMSLILLDLQLGSTGLFGF